MTVISCLMVCHFGKNLNPVAVWARLLFS